MNVQTQPEVHAGDYAWWKNALEGKFGEIHENDPQCGFYRQPGRDGKPDVPVAIWRSETGNIIQKPADAWTWCCRNPILSEVYCTVDAGSEWPDIIETEFDRKYFASDRQVGIDDNNPPDPKSYEGIAAELNSCTEELKRLKPAESQIEADTIANLSARVADISNRAEKQRVALVAPINKQKDDIQAKYNPIKKTARDTITSLTKLLTPWLNILDKRKQEDEAKRAKEQAEIKRKKEKDEKRKKDAEAGQAVMPALAPEKPQSAPLKAKDITKVGAGTKGRSAHLTTIYSVEVTDISALVLHYRDNPKVVELVEALAKADLQDEQDVPGAKLNSTKEARR